MEMTYLTRGVSTPALPISPLMPIGFSIKKQIFMSRKGFISIVGVGILKCYY
jgi:hypothetical protein